jgi:hypothetical protein
VTPVAIRAGYVWEISGRKSCSLCPALIDAAKVCAAASNRELHPITIIVLKFHSQHNTLPRIQVNIDDYAKGVYKPRSFPLLLHKHCKGPDAVKSPAVISVDVALSISWDLARGWYNTCHSEHNVCSKKRITSLPRGMLWICHSPQLPLNVDSVAGSGKTSTLLKTCAGIQELAKQAGEHKLVFQAAPTRIAAFNILRKTLHSFLQLLVKGKKSDLLVATL